ncbi:MAG: type II toxin-antitoxin system VapB family antitoxin [Candidatus Marinimicrobia bacterium]|nr:type II toxin-antitoxin system VapB family antitoxin [Candidatus Neomarinimicrobiota bacterium]
MATNLEIDGNLLNEAKEIAGLKTKKETVNQALYEFIQLRKQVKLLDLFGKIPYDEDYNYKDGRRKR